MEGQSQANESRSAFDQIRVPEQKHRDIVLSVGGCGISFIIEFLGVVFGYKALAWFGALSLLLALLIFTRNYLRSPKWIKYGSRILLAFVILFATYYLSKLKPASQQTESTPPSAQPEVVKSETMKREPLRSETAEEPAKRSSKALPKTAQRSPQTTKQQTKPATTTTPPVTVENSPGSAVSIGQQGGITAGTVNFGPPPPHLQWVPIEQKPPTNAQHPRSYAKIWLDQPLPDAKFAVICDRPCAGAETSSLAGYNYSRWLGISSDPAVAIFIIYGPNPFPADTYYTLGVESTDDAAVKIVAVYKFVPSTDEQRQQLMNLPH